MRGGASRGEAWQGLTTADSGYRLLSDAVSASLGSFWLSQAGLGRAGFGRAGQGKGQQGKQRRRTNEQRTYFHDQFIAATADAG